jgi:hypothetical protein
MQCVSGSRGLFGIAASASWILGAAVALGGCTQTPGTGQVAAAVPQAPARPAWPSLPENAACTKELNHYQALLDTDVGTGNLNRSVYNEIEIDMSRAANACAAGKDAEARAIMHATKIKHGYRDAA